VHVKDSAFRQEDVLQRQMQIKYSISNNCTRKLWVNCHLFSSEYCYNLDTAVLSVAFIVLTVSQRCLLGRRSIILKCLLDTFELSNAKNGTVLLWFARIKKTIKIPEVDTRVTEFDKNTGIIYCQKCKCNTYFNTVSVCL